MKLSARDAKAFLARPAPRCGILIYGADPMRIALKRKELVGALLGPGGEEEMRLTRLGASDLRSDKAALIDAVKATGFFPGPRAVLLEDATNAQADLISPALDDWAEGDATLIVTAGALKPSGLRKLFEGHKSAVTIAIYDDPMGRDEIEAELKRAGLSALSPDAMGALTDLARSIDPGDFRMTLGKIALYKLNDPAPLSADEVEALGPASVESAVDDLIDIVAEAATSQIAPVLSRLKSQGVTPVTLCIQTTRHFRALYAATAAPGGNALRGVPFSRRDRMERQANNWGHLRLEAALMHLTDTDLILRSSSQAPAMAVMERALVRLAHMARARI